MFNLNQIKVGSKILFRHEPFEVLEANHLKMGRGGAKLVTKLRNLKSGAIIEQTFAGDERLEEADITLRPAQFLYADGQTGNFMQNDTFAQFVSPITVAQQKFLKEGEVVDLMLWREAVIGIKLPNKAILEVTYTEPGFKGNTASAALKGATLETGVNIQVPLFVKTGDKIRVNTETGSYDSRV